MGADTGLAGMYAMATGDGDEKMVFPWLVAGASALYGLYGAGRALETWKYWADYQKNTGVKPRYPVRAGLYDWMPSAGGTLYGLSGIYNTYNYGSYRPAKGFDPYAYGMYG